MEVNPTIGLNPPFAKARATFDTPSQSFADYLTPTGVQASHASTFGAPGLFGRPTAATDLANLEGQSPSIAPSAQSEQSRPLPGEAVQPVALDNFSRSTHARFAPSTPSKENATVSGSASEPVEAPTQLVAAAPVSDEKGQPVEATSKPALPDQAMENLLAEKQPALAISTLSDPKVSAVLIPQVFSAGPGSDEPVLAATATIDLAVSAAALSYTSITANTPEDADISTAETFSDADLTASIQTDAPQTAAEALSLLVSESGANIDVVAGVGQFDANSQLQLHGLTAKILAEFGQTLGKLSVNGADIQIQSYSASGGSDGYRGS